MRVLILFLAAALALGVPAARAEQSTVRIGTVPNDTAGLPFYAADLGFYKKAGLNADLQILGNGNSIIEALVGGSLDIGSVGITAIEAGYKKGLPLVIISPGVIADASKARILSIMVRNGVPIETAKDFEGKIVDAVVLKSIGQLATNQWIDNNGGDSSKVKYLEVPFSATVAGFQQGRFDAAISAEPYSTAAKPYAHVFGPDPLSAVAKVLLENAYVATRPWAEGHPDQVRRFVLAMREAAVWANRNTAKSAVILSKYTKTDLDVINASPRAIYGEQLTPALIQPTIELTARYKLIDAPFKAEDIIFKAPR